MQTVSFAGSNYNIPNTRGDRPWSGLSDFVIAAAAKAINTAGGSFTLLADINFGATFGLVSTYYKSRTANVASAGQLRLASADTIKWRNNANGADIALSKNTSDELLWNSSRIILAGGGLIVNADVSASAAIAVSKLAALTASRAVVTDGSGFITQATTTATEIGYVNGVTSAIQTQINTKSPSASPTFTGTITLPVTADRALQTGTSSVLEASAVTKTELGYVSGVTSAIQTQINARVANPLTGDLAAGSHKITGLSAGTVAGDSVRYEQLKYISSPAQTLSTTNFSTTSSTFQTTNLSASITPSSASSRIKITVSATMQIAAATGVNIFASLFRGSTNLATGGNLCFARVRSAAAQTTVGSGSMTYIDSPATTSSVTYTVKAKNSDNTTQAEYGNSDDQIMILEEIV